MGHTLLSIFLNRQPTRTFCVAILILELVSPSMAGAGVCPKECRSAIHEFYLWLRGGASHGHDFKSVLEKVVQKQSLYIKEMQLNNLALSADEHSFLLAATMERKFVDRYFGETISRELADLSPDVKLIWDSYQRVPLSAAVDVYPEIALFLYGKSPESYSQLLYIASGRKSLTLGDLSNHLRSLLKQQVENDISRILKSVSATSEGRVTRSTLKQFLATVPADEGKRRRAARPIIGRWIMKNNSLRGSISTGDASLLRVYDLSKVGVGSFGSLSGYLATEKFVAPKAEWKRNDCAEDGGPKKVLIGRIRASCIHIQHGK